MTRPAFVMSAALLVGSAALLIACQPPSAGEPEPSERRDAAASEPKRDAGPVRRDMATSSERQDAGPDAASGPDVASSPDTGKSDAPAPQDAAGSMDAAPPDAKPPADTAPLPATWDTVFKTLQTHCNACHENAGNEMVLAKDKAMAHRYLTMTNAHHCKNGTTELKYIQPSDPLKSVIYLAMSDMKCAGSLPAKKMPPEGAGSFPSPAEIKAVEAWIKAGAKTN